MQRFRRSRINQPFLMALAAVMAGFAFAGSSMASEGVNQTPLTTPPPLYEMLGEAFGGYLRRIDHSDFLEIDRVEAERLSGVSLDAAPAIMSSSPACAAFGPDARIDRAGYGGSPSSKTAL